MNVQTRLAAALVSVLLTLAIFAPAIRASSEVTWTVRAVNLFTGNRFWYDSMSGQSRETLAAASYPIGTLAAVDSGTVTYWTVEEVSMPPITVKMWVAGAAQVAVLDADAYSVGDVAAVEAP